MAATIIIASVFVLFGLWWLLRPKGQSIDHLPRMKGWPVVENMLQVDSKYPERTFQEWGKQLGGVFAVKNFNHTAVVANSYNAIYEVLVKKGDDFAGRVPGFRNKVYSHNYENIAFTSPNARWRIMRKTVQRHIKTYDKELKKVEKCTIKVLHDLVSEFRRHQGRPFDPRNAVVNSVMNVITSFLVNKTYRETDEEFRMLKESVELFNSSFTQSGSSIALDVFPFLRFFGNSTFRSIQRFNHMLLHLWNRMTKQVLERGSPKDVDESDCILQAFLFLYNNQTDDTLKEVNLIAGFTDLIVGGTNTSGNTFYGFLNIISQHQEVQKKLAAEVDSVVGPNRAVSSSDRQNMPYTYATLLELVRYVTIVPLSVPHFTVQDTTLLGHHIPSGVIVYINLWGLHHDEDFWDGPYEFKPERFLDDDGQLVSASHENRKRLIPFGAGPRVCVGEMFAMERLFLLITTLAQMFNIQQSSEKVACDPRYFTGGAVTQPPDFTIIAECRNETLYRSKE